MRDIEYLRVKSKNYGLIADYVNENTLKVYSPKYDFDSWLIVETDKEIELWHKNKYGGLRNMSYHIQSVLPKSKKIWVLQRIKRHNEYTAFYKKRNKVNKVDFLLSREVPKFSIY